VSICRIENHNEYIDTFYILERTSKYIEYVLVYEDNN